MNKIIEIPMEQSMTRTADIIRRIKDTYTTVPTNTYTAVKTSGKIASDRVTFSRWCNL